MNTLLFAWNPAKNDWSEDEVAKLAPCVRRRESVIVNWNCVTRDGVDVRDRAYIIKLGGGNRGIFASGYLENCPYLSNRRNSSGKRIRCVDIKLDVLLDPREDPVLPMITLENDPDLAGMRWSIQSSGIPIPGSVLPALKSWWKAYRRPARRATLAEEVKAPFRLTEGAQRIIAVNAYERDPTARALCVEHHGTTCAACGLDLRTVYGRTAEGLIHVHHLKPLSDIGHAYRVDPVNDLIPVCPNCHAVIHRHDPPYTIRQIRSMIARNNKARPRQ